MIVDDQNTHRRWPKSRISLRCCIASDGIANASSAPAGLCIPAIIAVRFN
jgi:hypothetical protein